MEAGALQARVTLPFPRVVEVSVGAPETVAVVHCDAPMGTPPDGV